MPENKTRGSLNAKELEALGLDPKSPPPMLGEIAHAQADSILHPPEQTIITTAEPLEAFPGEEPFTGQMQGQRAEFLIEAIGHYRKQLEALVASRAVDPANAYGTSLLNPTPVEQVSRVVPAAERGIAKCNQLLRELGVDEEQA